YNIESYQIMPELAYQPSNQFRIITAYEFTAKTNPLPSEMPESAQIHQVSLELRWNKLIQRNLIANIRYINIDYEGPLNTPISYEMLEALQPGINWTWGLNWQQRLANGLQLNINYQGRKSFATRTVHIARMQVTALF
ncbi:MAG: hypothetical protein HC880_22345, partial [Bacteroidia bacterium]|nr:hypothetical protein [Bacteroidia bacterium]